MIAEEYIEISWHNKTRKHFEEKGYLFTKYKDLFVVKVEDLPHGSNKKIKVYCDYCLLEGVKTPLEVYYYKYLESRKIVQKDCCKSCSRKKVKDSNLKVYGVENIFQLEEIKEKSKNTQIEKYGELYSKTDTRKEQIKATNLEKYGVENPMMSKEIRRKAEKTNIIKYGVKNVFQSDYAKNKAKETISRRYGNGEELDNISQSEHYKVKFKETSLKRFNVEHPFMSEEVRDKIKATNIERYGNEFPMKNTEVLNKTLNTMKKKGVVKTSKQQIKIYKLLKDNGFNCKLNYLYSKMFLDIAIFIGEEKINLECDGLYWHEQGLQKDIRRDKYLQSEGWKTIRVVYDNNKKLPSIEMLKELIDKSLEGKIFQKLEL